MCNAKPYQRTILGSLVSLAASVGTCGATWSSEQTLPNPSGPIVLEVGGQVEVTNSGSAAVFDIEGLESLGLVEIVTDTPWTDGEVTFSGVLAREVLDAVGADGALVSAVALNDYSVKIPVADLIDYDVIIAVRRDGQRMRVRDRGPLWVIYPWSDHPELRTEVFYARSIWQLKAIEVTD